MRPFQKAALRLVVCQREGSAESDPRLRVAPEPAEEIGAGGMEVAVVVERKLVDEQERCFAAADGEAIGTPIAA